MSSELLENVIREIIINFCIYANIIDLDMQGLSRCKKNLITARIHVKSSVTTVFLRCLHRAFFNYDHSSVLFNLHRMHFFLF